MARKIGIKMIKKFKTYIKESKEDSIWIDESKSNDYLSILYGEITKYEEEMSKRKIVPDDYFYLSWLWSKVEREKEKKEKREKRERARAIKIIDPYSEENWD
jgi:hypothetical protein